MSVSLSVEARLKAALVESLASTTGTAATRVAEAFEDVMDAKTFFDTVRKQYKDSPNILDLDCVMSTWALFVCSKYRDITYNPECVPLGINGLITRANVTIRGSYADITRGKYGKDTLFLKASYGNMDDTKIDVINAFVLSTLAKEMGISQHFMDYVNSFKCFLNKDDQLMLAESAKLDPLNSTAYTSGTYKSCDCFVFRNISGNTMDAVLALGRRSGPGATGYLLEKLDQLGDVLSLLREKFGIFHNDLHGGNIMFDTESECFRLIDYGRLTYDWERVGPLMGDKIKSAFHALLVKLLQQGMRNDEFNQALIKRFMMGTDESSESSAFARDGICMFLNALEQMPDLSSMVSISTRLVSNSRGRPVSECVISVADYDRVLKQDTSKPRPRFVVMGELQLSLVAQLAYIRTDAMKNSAPGFQPMQKVDGGVEFAIHKDAIIVGRGFQLNTTLLRRMSINKNYAELLKAPSTVAYLSAAMRKDPAQSGGNASDNSAFDAPSIVDDLLDGPPTEFLRDSSLPPTDLMNAYLNPLPRLAETSVVPQRFAAVSIRNSQPKIFTPASVSVGAGPKKSKYKSKTSRKSAA